MELLRHVALVRIDVSEENSAAIFRVTRIGELRTTLVVTSNRHTLRNIPEDCVLDTGFDAMRPQWEAEL
jgi:hypothetical protein